MEQPKLSPLENMPPLLDRMEQALTSPQSLQVIVTPNELSAAALHKSLRTLGAGKLSPHDIVLIPGFLQAGVFRYESARSTLAKRLGAAQSMLVHTPRIVICSVSALLRSFPTPQWISDTHFTLRTGEEWDIDKLLELLNQRVYTQVERVEDVGEYSVRGSLVDLWTPGEDTPTRIEFFGDHIEALRSFRAADQRSFRKIDEVCVLPSREFVWPTTKEMPEALERFNDIILGQKIVGDSRVHLLEDLEACVAFPGIDDVSYMFQKHENPALYDILSDLSVNQKKQCTFLSLHPSTEIDKEVEHIVKVYDDAVGVAQSHNVIYAKKEKIFVRLGKWNNSHYQSPDSTHKSLYAIPETILNILNNSAPLKLAGRLEALKQLHTSGQVPYIVVLTPHKDSFNEFVGMLSKTFPTHEDTLLALNVVPFDFSSLQKPYPPLYCLELSAEGGFWSPHTQTLFISENWIRGFHTSSLFDDVVSEDNSKRAAKTSAETFMAAQYADFISGDFVVHVQHGIACFRGLMTIKIQDITGDFLVLEYADNDKIYVPVSKLNLVQKYIGAHDNVTLDSLKSGQWEKRKEKAKKDVEKLAAELLEHSAKRAMTPGFAFGPLGADDMIFEDAFPFDDTPDQIKATREIITDMTLPKAMDRLLCGDVGFGKTEVAMRAAYHAVVNGKQVAWLVPTTVLAHQHVRSLKERFADFGVSVALLDRSVGVGSKALEDLKKGSIDILVGTHRILSPDVVFRDLGFLIVDEEQRFGVLQKEKIKTMSYGVDVLTMTATPIPRTLQMAMVGLRELSLLTTPPKARLATKTFVCPFEDGIVSSAIQFELSRGGQVFYVHNRVEELEGVQAYLNGLLPHMRIAVGHGKMTQKELEKTIIAFLDGKYDLLLCTTIIESGIDMPNVNTILVQNADHFGLAQLYQLRGRVGRRSSRGYAYFLTTSQGKTDTAGLKRLEVLREHQDLGSGFVIASHDLEMRGSGNILGDEQSGKMNGVGLETYLQMLNDAIKTKGGQKVIATQEVEIQIPVVSQIPEDYVENPKERLKMYRRFFGAQEESILQSLMSECEDRFGPMPIAVQWLGEISRVRRFLLSLGATSLTVGDDYTEIKLDKRILQPSDDDEAGEELVKRILDVCNRRVNGMRITPDGRLLMPLKKRSFVNDVSGAFGELKRILGLLAG